MTSRGTGSPLLRSRSRSASVFSCPARTEIAPGLDVRLVDLAVIGVQTVGRQVGQTGDERIERRGRLAGIDARPAHADLEIDQNRDRPIDALRRVRQGAGRVGMIDQRRNVVSG